MPSMSSMFSDLKYRLRAIFRRKSMENELAAELQFHCEQQAAKLVGAGVPRDEALRRARLAIGGVEQVKEECREARGVAALESTAPDVQLRPAAVSPEAGLRAGRRHLAGARHRRQYGNLQPHRRGPAPHAAHRRSGRTSAARPTPDEREHSRIRIPGVSPAPRRRARCFGCGRLWPPADQRQPRREHASRLPKDSWYREATFGSWVFTPSPAAQLTQKTT